MNTTIQTDVYATEKKNDSEGLLNLRVKKINIGTWFCVDAGFMSSTTGKHRPSST